MNKLLQTHYNRLKQPPQKIDQKEIIETAGYISKEKRISQLIAAGERLLAIRKGYDVQNGESDDIDIDPTRRKDFDLTDADDCLARAEATIKNVAERSKKKEVVKNPLPDKVDKDRELEEKGDLSVKHETGIG